MLETKRQKETIISSRRGILKKKTVKIFPSVKILILMIPKTKPILHFAPFMKDLKIGFFPPHVDYDYTILTDQINQ